jgi:hypothetical protein
MGDIPLREARSGAWVTTKPLNRNKNIVNRQKLKYSKELKLISL